MTGNAFTTVLDLLALPKMLLRGHLDGVVDGEVLFAPIYHLSWALTQNDVVESVTEGLE